jgi:Domain of unknown function (DUF6265)
MRMTVTIAVTAFGLALPGPRTERSDSTGTWPMLALTFAHDGAQTGARPATRPCQPRAKPAEASRDPASTPAGAAQATIAQVAWISGTWIGSAGNVTVEERWTPTAGGSMLGIGRTLRNGAMAGFEFLCIAERDGSLVYTAMPNARTPLTDFMLTAITADSATFENPAHDFPKRVRYSRRADGALETTISGDANQPKESFVLTREAAK